MTVRTEEAAAALMSDHERGKNIVPFARSYGAADIAGAYAIQLAYNKLQDKKQGRRIGYKIGLTSKRMQQMCGVDHPNSGVVFEKRIYRSGVTLSLGSLVHLGLEFECCARVGKMVAPRKSPYSLDEIAAAVEAVAPAFEVIDDRNSAYPLDLLSLIADNSWNEGNVIGEFRTSWPDLAGARSTLECDGKVIDHGFGRDVLGHPFEPLRWLANSLSSQGRTLEAGEIVLTGSWVTTRFPKAGEHYRHTIEGIGSVEVTLAA